MPAKSKRQARFMRGVASGKIKRRGLSPEEASEFVEGQPTKGLPERAKGKGKKKESKLGAMRHRLEMMTRKRSSRR